MKKRIAAVLLAMAMVLGLNAPAASASTYTVVKGDNLSALAARYLGSARLWTEIYAANRDRIANPGPLSVICA